MSSAMTSRPAGERRLDAAGGSSAGAACLEPGTDPDLFFPPGEAGLATQRQVAQAKALCARCPVMEQCRDWAVTSGESEGIWGGTTPAERRVLRGRLPRAVPAGSRVA